VDHPGKWECCGYNEIQNPRTRKGIIDFDRLIGLLGFETYEQLKQAHFKWVDSAIQAENKGRQAKWTQSIAVGSEPFFEKIKEALGFRARGRKIRRAGEFVELRETPATIWHNECSGFWNRLFMGSITTRLNPPVLALIRALF